MESEFYDLLAKTAEPVSDSVRRLMLQDLLAKRFELVAHFETKQLPSYELLVGEGGLKIRPVEPEGPPGRVYGRKNGVRAEQASMRVLADVLTRELDRPVLDKTGVVVTPGLGYGQWGEGYFRISLTYPDDVIRTAVGRILDF